MKNFGEIFRYFRESKNMSLREVAGRIASASQISRFERGKTEINVESFYYCLHTMNISMYEFENKYNEFNHISNVMYNTNFPEACLERDVSKLEILLGDELDSDVESSRLNSIIIKIAIFMCDSSKRVQKSDIEYLSDYLFSIDSWNKYETWLFCNSIPVIPFKTLEVLGNEFMSNIHIHKQNANYNKEIYIALLNIANYFLERDNLGLALKYIDCIEDLNIPESEMYVRVLYKCTSLIYLYKTGHVSSLSELVRITELLDLINCSNSSKKIKRYLSRLQISNKDL